MKFVVLLAMLAVLAQATQVCGDEQATKKDATDALAEKINAALKVRSTMVATATGEISSQKDTIVREIDRSLLNLQAVKMDSVGNGRFKACMLKTEAAKPYLNSLRNLSAKLVNLGKKINQESCKAIYETYADIENAELVLTPLGQMDAALEKEYKPAYAKAKEECGKAGKGVYIESDSEEIAGKMASFFREFGCDIAENIFSASLALSLKDVIAGEGCEQGTDGRGFAYCYACVKKINLQDGKTGNSLYKEAFKSSRGSYKDMETACKMAQENTPQELWNKMQGKIKKENCK